LEREEGYVPNSNYQSQNTNTNAGYGAQNNQVRQNNMNVQPEELPPFPDQNYGDVNTQDDVPF
jgi:hypothetical protein